MKKIFRKAITVLSSVALIGSTMGAALAASYPSSFTSDTAVVYGANAAPSDFSAASNIVANLDSVAAGSSVTLTGGEGVQETEIPLGEDIISGKIPSSVTDTKVSALADDKISWDDGGASGTDDYNYQEQIVLTADKVKLLTTLDDNDFTENVALTNDKGVEYRFVFDDAFNVTGVGDANADDFYLTLLGKQYEITSMANTSFTVTTSTEYPLKIGESAVVGGKTFTIEDLSATAVKVNGETLTTSAKKINGLRVKVKTGSIFYNENFPENAGVTLQIGSDISKTYSDGEEYIGEDENDPEWVFTMSNPSAAGGYIGVKYNYKQTRDTDDVVYKGGSYILPENFAEIKFDGLTDVTYEDFKVSFDSTEDLWNNTQLTSTADVEDAPVMTIEALNGDKDAILMTDGSTESNKMYLRWADNDSAIASLADAPYGALEVYYSDVNGDVAESIKPRYNMRVNATSDGAFASKKIADLIVGDTTVEVNATAVSGGLTLTLTDNGAAKNITIDVGGAALANTTGTLKWLGGVIETTSKEVAEAGDVAVQGTNIGTYDYDVMTYNGLIVKEPEANAKDDEVLISVPSDRVYGIVSVLAGGAATNGEAGALIVKDSEIAQMSGKNLIVVGGSAINSVAADLLGGAFSEAAFTAQTSVDAGKFLIQSFNRNGKTALLVAGYNAADTEKASIYLLNNANAVDTTVGKKYIGTSSTEATLVIQ